MQKTINIVIPAYNEAENIKLIYECLNISLSNIDKIGFKFTFIDDGSKDGTASEIIELSQKDSRINYIIFSKNFGKDIALKAGFDRNDADAVVTIDADLQHPPNLIVEFIQKWEEGFQIVYAYRGNEKIHEKTFNNIGSSFFYWIMNKLTDFDIRKGTSDFRLIDKVVVNALRDMNEIAPFYRGLIKWVGFNQIGVLYKPHNRQKGMTKYNNKALIQMALSTITSFSIKPLGIAIYLGFLFSLLSLLYIPYALISFLNGYTISGWTSVIVTIAFFGGLQLMILGIIGMYLGKLFMQSKQRPHYLVKATNIGK